MEEEALPRERYVDDATWRDERDAVLHGEWFCVGRRDDLGLSGPGAVVTVDVAGESVLVTSDGDGRLHAAYNVCRHRGSQLRPVTGEPDPVPLPANPTPQSLQYVTVYDNHDKGGFAGSKPVSAPETFRCGFIKAQGQSATEEG